MIKANFQGLNKQRLIAPLLTIGVFFFCLCTVVAGPPRYIGSSGKLDVVVIDAGHGGKDPGAVSARANEKDVALKLALKLGKKIEANYPDVKVVYTRKTDKFVHLWERAHIANEVNADLFISVHCNSVSNPNPNGSETFVLGLHKNEANLEVAKRENSVILLEDDYKAKYDFDPNSRHGHIMLSMFQNDFLDKSIAFATKVENNAVHTTKRTSRGVKQAGFLVLAKTFAPAVLVEAGFLSNVKEESYLISKKGQDQIANSIFNAFREYKAEVDQTAVASQEPATWSSQSEEVATEKKASSSSALPSYASNGSVQSTPVKKTTQPKTTTRKVQKVASTSTKAQDSNDGKKTEVITVVKKTLPKAKDEVQYFIQLAAVSKKSSLVERKWSKYQDKLLVRYENNLYKYQLGGFDDYQVAMGVKGELKTDGFGDAFIIAYRSGSKISLEEAFASANP